MKYGVMTCMSTFVGACGRSCRCKGIHISTKCVHEGSWGLISDRQPGFNARWAVSWPQGFIYASVGIGGGSVAMTRGCKCTVHAVIL